MTKKKTAMVKVAETPKQGLALKLPEGRRLPGAAVTTNPLVAMIACMTDEHVKDLGEEIEVTKTYLAKLQVVYDVVKPAPPKPIAVEVIEPPEPEPEPVIVESPRSVGGAPLVPATKEAGTWAGGRPKQAVSMQGVIRAMLVKNADANTKEIVAEVRRQCPASTASDKTIYSSISTVKSQMRSDGLLPPKSEAPLKTRPVFDPMSGRMITAPPPSPVVTHTDNSDGDNDDEELDLRKDVAELIFKKGLLTAGEIVRQAGVPPARIGEFMKHPWFEYVERSQQWRLTTLGKQEGIDY